MKNSKRCKDFTRSNEDVPDADLHSAKDEGCWLSVPHLQILLGISWEKYFDCRRYFLNSKIHLK